MAPTLLLLAALGCGRDPLPAGGEPPATELCPRPAATVTAAGDGNGDGVVDLADAVLVLRHRASGGPAPACAAGVDLIPDGKVELDDAFALLLHLGEGLFELPELAAECDGAPGLTAPDCAGLELDFAVSTVGAGDRATVGLQLSSASLASEAWSLRLSAEGCVLTGATTTGTMAAALTDSIPGVRDQGYALTRLVDEEARSTVVLGFMDAVALPAGQAATVLLLELEVPDCSACSLRLEEGTVVASGASWPLAPRELSLELCG